MPSGTTQRLQWRLSKVGGGHPSNVAIRKLREKFEADPDWYPGKVSDDAGQPGRPKVISPTQESALAKSAMTLKSKGIVPTAASVIAQCKKASLNPETGEPFHSQGHPGGLQDQVL